MLSQSFDNTSFTLSHNFSNIPSNTQVYLRLANKNAYKLHLPLSIHPAALKNIACSKINISAENLRLFYNGIRVDNHDKEIMLVEKSIIHALDYSQINTASIKIWLKLLTKDIQNTMSYCCEVKSSQIISESLSLSILQLMNLHQQQYFIAYVGKVVNIHHTFQEEFIENGCEIMIVKINVFKDKSILKGREHEKEKDAQKKLAATTKIIMSPKEVVIQHEDFSHEKKILTIKSSTQLVQPAFYNAEEFKKKKFQNHQGEMIQENQTEDAAPEGHFQENNYDPNNFIAAGGHVPAALFGKKKKKQSKKTLIKKITEHHEEEEMSSSPQNQEVKKQAFQYEHAAQFSKSQASPKKTQQFLQNVETSQQNLEMIQQNVETNSHNASIFESLKIDSLKNYPEREQLKEIVKKIVFSTERENRQQQQQNLVTFKPGDLMYSGFRHFTQTQNLLDDLMENQGEEIEKKNQ